MLKLIVLISIIVVLSEVRSNSSNGSNLELKCPQGWAASTIIRYKCSYLPQGKETSQWSTDFKNCLFCMTCVRNPSSSEVFGNVEVCLVTLHWFAPYLDSKKSFRFLPETNGYEVLPKYQNNFCGIRLPLFSQNPTNDDMIQKPCDGQQNDSETKTTELTCPNSFFLVSRYLRNITDNQKTWCIHCQSFIANTGNSLRITMCYPHYIQKLAAYSFDQGLGEKCKNAGSDLQVATQIYCGIKFDGMKVGDCIPCQSGKYQESTVSSISRNLKCLLVF